MSENVISRARYIKGHSDLGEQTIDVLLFELPSNLTVARNDDRTPLFSIPWGNFHEAQIGQARKRGMRATAAWWLSAIPLTSILRAGNDFDDGVWISYWDEDIERDQAVFFAAFTDRHAEELYQKIYRCRDQYVRMVKKQSGPTRRSSG